MKALKLVFLCFLIINLQAVPLYAENLGIDADVLPSAPLTLSQAIDLALIRNPDLHAAQARIQMAQGRLKEVEAAFYPQFKAGLSYVSSNNPSRAFGMIVAQRRFDFGMDINDPGFQEDFRPEIGMQWSLFRGGQDYYQRQAAKLGIDATEAQKTAIRNGLATAVSASFYALLEAPQRIDVAKRTLTTVSKELEFMRARKAQGMALKSDVLSLEVRLAQAQEQQIQALNAKEAAKAALRTLLAFPPEARLEVISGDSTQVPATPGEFNDWLQKALTHRPELIAADKQVKAQEKVVKAAQGARLPRLNVFATYGQNSKNPQFSTNKDNLTMGVQAEVDLFTGGAISARIHQAKQKLDEIRALRQQTQLQVEKEVKQAWLNLREALARLEVAKRALAAADEALKLVRAQHRGGTATVTRSLEAETDAAAARLHLITARFNALVAEAELKRATGEWIHRESSDDPPFN